LNSLSSYDSPVTYRTKEDRADAELRQLLGSDISDTESMRRNMGTIAEIK
jgi:hypothetical protein